MSEPRVAITLPYSHWQQIQSDLENLYGGALESVEVGSQIEVAPAAGAAHKLTTEDDGDEVVYVKLDGEDLIEVNHDEHGWAGMTAILDALKTLAGKTGVEVDDQQSIV